MSIWKKLRGELIDIVEWLDDSRDTLVYRFQRHNNEIKYGAQLTVREGQAAVFIEEGALADVFGPGRHVLTTQNLPILSTLRGWKYGFESPFKAEVYFVSTRQFTDLKWGTMNPVMLRDAEFGPVRLRAFGTYAIRVSDPGKFVREISGTTGRFTADGITDQLRNFIISEFTDTIGESRIPILDLAANYNELGRFVRDQIAPHYAALGLELTAFLVENISLPPEVEKALDKRSSMGIIGDLRAFTQYQTGQAIGDAATAPGGSGMAQGMGLGAGFAMAQQMAQAMQPSAAPPPLPGAPGAAALWVALDGRQDGPLDEHALRSLVSTGRLTAQTLVWRQGLAGWLPAAQVPEAQRLLAQVPPPLPDDASGGAPPPSGS
ncbi:MAG: SPFH domain-containing protein [Phycisphaeraceae bacterium]|nr:SPFH domain-containing protein [Phycisphaeraceae bacterium]